MIHILFDLVRAILGLLAVLLIVQVVLSWLFAFDVVSRRNQLVYSIFDFTRRLTDPLLNPIRRVIPTIQGVDLSTLVLLLIIFLLRDSVSYWLEGVLRGGPVL